MTLLEKIISLNYDSKKAKSLIMSGDVLVNEEPIIISSYKIKENDVIRIRKQKKWVSRGAYKLLKALEYFNLNVKDKICLDIGSSTGGFTQVLLENGAYKIFSLDSGFNQLDYSLRINKKVISLEKTNLKSISFQLFKTLLDIVVCDVSFISIKNVFNVLNFNVLSKENKIVILIKPQFEAPSNLVQEGGYVDKIYHEEIINNIIDYAKQKGFRFLGLCDSPLLGNKSKNIEYLSLFERE